MSTAEYGRAQRLKVRSVVATMLDEREYLSCYGIRALSRYHAQRPYVFQVGDQEYRVSYLPAESDTGKFGGNSTGWGRSGCLATA